MIRLPIGVSDFSELVDTAEAYAFIDKTLLIRDFIQDGARVVLFTRPRRFGKTLTLSMLHYFFSCTVKQDKNLFEGLNIEHTGEAYLRHQTQYPTIFITLKHIEADTIEAAYQGIADLLAKCYFEHQYLLDGSVLADHEKNLFHNILHKQANQSEFKNALFMLSEWLHRYHGKKTIILIDEYDTPIHAAYLNDYYEPMVNLMRGMLGAALKDNVHLYKGAMTGILRVAKENIFSGLNNLIVYSFLDEEYSQYFGFTEQEVNGLFVQSGLNANLASVRQWYNGYRIGQHTLYNPWSIITCLHKKGGLAPYWVNTSSNALVQDLLTGANVDIQQDFERLMLGETIEAMLAAFLNLKHIESSHASILTLLCMSGYLINAEIAGQIEDDTVYRLRIPNKEVRIVYRDIFMGWLAGDRDKTWIVACIDDLKALRMVEFTQKLQQIAINIFSYHDVKGRAPEAFFHGFMLGLIVYCQADYQIHSNREAGHGRYDIAMLPKATAANLPGILFEIKSCAQADQACLEKAAEQALAQIDEKRYAAAFQQQPVGKQCHIGIAFSGKQLALAFLASEG